MPDLPDLALPTFALPDGLWPLAVLVLRIAVAGALYLFLVAAFRALRAELRAEAAEVPVPVAEGAAPRPRIREVPADRAAWLEIVRCDGAAELAGRRYPLEDVTLIGRAADNTVVLPDGRVSARHARLAPRNGDWWIEDLGSTNGTYVGRHRVAEPERVEPSTELRFGPVVARVTQEAAR